MAHQLWLLRHAEAVPHGIKPDADRELTERGRRQADAAGVALAALGETFAACYTSPKVRAVETAALACVHLDLEPVVETSLANGFSRVDALALLEAHEADAHVLVVGHEPSFSQVVHDCTGARVDFKKGGVAAIDSPHTHGHLIALLRPRELRAMR
ncbi:MAG TPA: phosphoglycerate mutase family protein [Solirubrobacter sp.]|nr:phosphoglycerate mutase family protein [Solirubrobacter sp.]